MNQIDTGTYFETSDLALAAALSIGFSIEQIRQVSLRKSNFVFQRSNKLNDFVEDYWRGEIRVEPQQYFNQIKIIKTRLYAGV